MSVVSDNSVEIPLEGPYNLNDFKKQNRGKKYQQKKEKEEKAGSCIVRDSFL